MVFQEMAQIIPDPSNTYLVRFQGALGSPTVDWCGDVTIITQEQGDTLVKSVHQSGSLRDFLDQFQDLCLTVLPNEGTKENITHYAGSV